MPGVVLAFDAVNLSPHSRTALLEIARRSIRGAVTGAGDEFAEPRDEELTQPAGCFVNVSARRDDPTAGTKPSSSATARFPPPALADSPAIAIIRSIAGNCREPNTPRASPVKILLASASSAFQTRCFASVSKRYFG